MLVGARRWPLSSAHPDAWEYPHSGRVLPRNDPSAWENTLAFPNRRPTQAEVDQHLETLAATRAPWSRSWVEPAPGKTEPTLEIPVAWEFAKIYWETVSTLRPYDEDVAEWQEKRAQARKALRGSRGVARSGRPAEKPPSTYDNPDYAFYVTLVSFPRTPPGVIDSGWEYKQDANDRKKELEGELADSGGTHVVRVLSRQGLKGDFIDPEDDARWRATIPRRSV